MVEVTGCQDRDPRRSVGSDHRARFPAAVSWRRRADDDRGRRPTAPARDATSTSNEPPPSGPIGSFGQTIPAKFSKRNDTLDHVPTMAIPLPLTLEQRKQIYDAVMAEKSSRSPALMRSNLQASCRRTRRSTAWSLARERARHRRRVAALLHQDQGQGSADRTQRPHGRRSDHRVLKSNGHRRSFRRWRFRCALFGRSAVIVGRALPLCQAVADHLHGGHGCVAEAGIAGNFPTDAFALATKHFAHAL